MSLVLKTHRQILAEAGLRPDERIIGEGTPDSPCRIVRNRPAPVAMARGAGPQDDDDDFAAMREERRLRSLHGHGRPPAPQVQRSATEVVNDWIEASAAEGVARSAAIADLQKRDPATVRRWVAEVNAAAGRGGR